jgi:hypothetical protein
MCDLVRASLVALLSIASVAYSGDPPADQKCSIPKSVLDIMANSKELELFSLDPTVKARKDGKAYYDWHILGSTHLRVEDQKKGIVSGITGAVTESTYGDMGVCFRPRHGIRAVKGKDTADLLVCFECWRIEIYHNNKLISTEAIKREPSTLLNDILMKAKVPLAPPPVGNDK